MSTRFGSLAPLLVLSFAIAGCPGGMTVDDDTGGGIDGGSEGDGGGDRDVGGDDGGGGTPDGGCTLDCPDAGTTPDGGSTIDGGGAATCGGIAGAPCGRSEYCDIVEGASFCGAAGTCQPRPIACPDVFAPVCGCDGADYDNGCAANAAGVDWIESGSCTATTDCEPDQAVGEGACDLFLGWAWDGTECVGLSGCSCRGADCGSLDIDMDVCVRAHAGCGSTTGAFACGPDLSCVTGTEYCQAVSGGPAGAVRHACADLPRAPRCRAAPSCTTCFPDPSPAGGTCTEAGAGEITVLIAAP